MGSQASKADTLNNNNENSTQNEVGFSQPFVDYLQNSSENDSIRAKALELEIQARVNAELQRLQALAAKEYAELQAKISADEEEVKEPNKYNSSNSHGKDEDSQVVSAGDRLRQLGREAVQGDIRELKSKLEKSKRVRELDENVNKAKSEVVTCLKENDRRPLDCWAQIENFKKEVARLEDSWIQKVVS